MRAQAMFALLMMVPLGVSSDTSATAAAEREDSSCVALESGWITSLSDYQDWQAFEIAWHGVRRGSPV